MSMTPGQIAGTVLFVAPSRIATLTFAAFTTVLGLEAARRVVRVVTDYFGYSPKTGVGKTIADWTPQVIHTMQQAVDYPVDEDAAKKGEGITNRQLLKSFAICAVIANVGWEFSKWLSGGEVSPYYNVVARFVGPLVLDTTYRHPAIQFGVDMAKRAFPVLN